MHMMLCCCDDVSVFIKSRVNKCSGPDGHKRIVGKIAESNEELNRVISCINEVATYIKIVLDLYKDE